MEWLEKKAACLLHLAFRKTRLERLDAECIAADLIAKVEKVAGVSRWYTRIAICFTVGRCDETWYGFGQWQGVVASAVN